MRTRDWEGEWTGKKNMIRIEYTSLGTCVKAATVSLILLASPATATDGYFLHGVGVKAKGTGGVAIALPQDASAIATNPATATEVEHQLDIGVDVFIPDRSARIEGNQVGLDGEFNGNSTNPFVLGDISYVRPVSDTVSVGIAIYANGGMNTDYRDNPFKNVGGQGAAGVDLKQAFIVPTLAVKVAEDHSVGASAIGLVQGFRTGGVAPFSQFSNDPANFSDKGTDWSFGAGFKVGYYGKFGDALSVGAFYQSKVHATRFDKYSGLFADGGRFNVPESWGVGAALKLAPTVTVAADFKRINYDGIEAVGNSIALLFEGKQLGDKDGPGFGWRSISAYKVGAVWEASPKLTLRAGYGRSENPVPPSETLMNIVAPGVVQDHFTLGATFKLSESTDISAYAMRAPRNEVAGAGSIPALFGGGEASIALAETSLGLSVGFKL